MSLYVLVGQRRESLKLYPKALLAVRGLRRSSFPTQSAMTLESRLILLGTCWSGLNHDFALAVLLLGPINNLKSSNLIKRLLAIGFIFQSIETLPEIVSKFSESRNML